MDNAQEMHTGFLRLPDVLKLIPISKSTWWQGIKEGRFPSGVKIGAKITAWRVEDIQRLAASISDTPPLTQKDRAKNKNLGKPLNGEDLP